MSYFVFSVSDFVDFVLLVARTMCGLSLQFVVNALGICHRLGGFGIRLQCSHEIAVFDEAVPVMIEYFGHFLHLQTRSRELCGKFETQA